MSGQQARKRDYKDSSIEVPALKPDAHGTIVRFVAAAALTGSFLLVCGLAETPGRLRMLIELAMIAPLLAYLQLSRLRSKR
jgi:hypothetical protein